MKPTVSGNKYSCDTLKLSSNKSVLVTIGSGIADQVNKLFDFSGYSTIVLITDRTVAGLYGQAVTGLLESAGKPVFMFIIPTGERSKSLSTVERGYRFLVENKIDRKAIICVLGGGVAGDAGGYIAATYLRGVDYIQIPTTLLAQVDSSIGGKVGINFKDKKNLIGSFYQPKAVISDTSFLKTLPEAEFRNGLAEIIKYGISMDENLFNQLESEKLTNTDNAKLVSIISRCVYLKSRIVETDELERNNKRFILNFGHTIGHAIESAGNLRRYRHGEAVAIGMTGAARISEYLGMLSKNSVMRLYELLKDSRLPTCCPELAPRDLKNAIQFDKKTSMGKTAWVLLQNIGEGITNQSVPDKILSRVLAESCK